MTLKDISNGPDWIMAIWEDRLPAEFAYVFLAVVLIDCVIMIVLTNTVCKR